jgi:hypothetical protein
MMPPVYITSHLIPSIIPVNADQKLAATSSYSIILEQHTNTLPMMHPSNRLREHIAHLQHLQLLAPLQVLLLRDTVGDDYLI